MDVENLEPWNTPLYKVPHLANLEMHAIGEGNLSIGMEDLDSKQTWRISLSDVVAFRFTRNFHRNRMCNTFVVRDSPWLADLLREPFLLPGELEGTRHYLIYTLSGEIAILAKAEPLFEVC